MKADATTDALMRRGKRVTASSRAQARAFQRLRDAHREEYDKYFSEEKDKAERELGLK